jgi:hypothetical protein
MNELFSGKLAPITDTIGFLRCEPEDAASYFVDWQTEIQIKRGVSVKSNRLSGDIIADMRKLLPLNNVEKRRFLFIPTRSNWTAFLDNGRQGTDTFPVMSYLAGKMSCAAVSETYVPEGYNTRYAATLFEMYGPEKTEFLNIVRSVGAGFDGAKWSFSATGEVQPFEDVQQYSNRVIKKRFTGEMLKEYLNHLEIAAFDESFYCPNGEPAILVEKFGPIAPAAREFGLWSAESS